MPTAADLQPAAGYDDRWLVLAVASLAAVAAYYLVVWWATRPRRVRPPSPRSQRQRCIAALEEIETAVAERRLSPRAAHQQVSQVVRGFVEETSAVPAGRMTLASLRREGPDGLADLVAVLYPPEFAPGDERAALELDGALRRARELVTTWS